jgi:hypothetical protein
VASSIILPFGTAEKARLDLIEQVQRLTEAEPELGFPHEAYFWDRAHICFGWNACLRRDIHRPNNIDESIAGVHKLGHHHYLNIRRFYQQHAGSTWGWRGPFTQSFFAPLENGTVCAFAGPAELIFSNAVLFTFYRLTNAAIYSEGIANDPIGIPIAPNKTMHVFGVPAHVNASFNRPGSAGGGTLSFMLQPNSPAEFTGPGTLFLNSGVFFPYAKFISYFIADDGFAMPGQRAIACPSGGFAITVEKSIDLRTWSPVLMENTADPVKAYYRRRSQR